MRNLNTNIKNKIEKSVKRRIILTEAEIEKIKNELPEQPWIKGVHKIVAERLNLPTKTVQTGIAVLIKRGVFKNQIDGKIIE